MSEGSEGSDRSTAPSVPARVEPDAAVVSLEATVPPDAHEEATAALRPVATARAVGGRLKRLLGGDAGRTGR
ncbi:hypothetical protein Hbl1158_13000 [Halobaculum sp. CBA1158]|uniref:hypothetical protein n=1 Tax=Halobaculum sp. CBA1158 TaxID=2904243 RepID=UPI001F3858BD|nr:hypothetical protein [Halobaculum sp. CBA1158]UIO99431.1 hypothetical protein Hbl1158_13000 [Halobaculum sp. CBA1158]